jgi:hypothetical protein
MVIKLTDNRFNPEPYWTQPVAKLVYLPTAEDIALFDQNGYDLTVIEQHYAYGNYTKPKKHREHIRCLKEDWFVQDCKIEGAVLNHSNLFERKGYAGQALTQLKEWARDLPLLHKIIALRPKWGLDFSMDYVDRAGNAFEVLHWEYDSFDYEEVQVRKLQVQAKFATIDWDAAALQILKHKDQWHHLDFFEQSQWKCEYFGIPNERFKMVAWE